MKKGFQIPLAVTAILLIATAGFFLYRFTSYSPIQISTRQAPSPSVQKLDINTATAEQLDALPGIGMGTANAIVSYRNEHGSFERVSDLLNIPGLGEGKLTQIAEYITVGG